MGTTTTTMAPPRRKRSKSGPPVGRLFAGAALTALTGIAIAGTFVQLDHEAAHRPALAKYVPEAFREEALLQLAARDVDAPDGLETAKLLVERRPVPAESLSVLTLAAFHAGDEALAARALGEAATRGWRNPMAQQAMFESGVAVGNWDVALGRLVALWRAGRRDELLVSYMQRVVDSPEGRAALLGRFSTDGAWLDEFFVWAPSKLTPRAFTQLVDEASTLGLPVKCEAFRRSAFQLANSGEAEALQRIWSGQCAKGSAPSGSFRWTQPSAKGGPLDWNYAPDSGVEWSLSSDEPSPALAVRNRDSLAASAARRFDVLPAGTHGVRITMKGRASPGDAALKVICIDSAGKARGAANLDASSSDLSLPIPADCPVQRFDLMVGRTALEDVRISVD